MIEQLTFAGGSGRNPAPVPGPPARLHGAHRNTDPATSRAAARRPRTQLRARILEAFTEHGDLTDDELAAILSGYPAPTVKSCRSRIYDRGRGPLAATGEVRASNYGAAMQVWRLRRRTETVRDPRGRVA